MNSINRRTFLAGAAAAAIAGCRTSKHDDKLIRVGPATEEASGLMFEESQSPTMSDGSPAIRIVTLEADGSPVSDDA
jgi:hypothetical protein